jgi:hypothetical protein
MQWFTTPYPNKKLHFKHANHKFKNISELLGERGPIVGIEVFLNGPHTRAP